MCVCVCGVGGVKNKTKEQMSDKALIDFGGGGGGEEENYCHMR